MKKYVCLGYIEPGKFESMSERERNAFVDGCFAYDDVLREGGHFAGGEALEPASRAVTLRFRGGEVSVTDGPYAETKEQIEIGRASCRESVEAKDGGVGKSRNATSIHSRLKI